MRKISVYEFKDLSKAAQDFARKDFIESVVHGELDMLRMELDAGEITEEVFYKRLGCSKHYAETTGWFIPGCFYEENRKELDEIIEDNLKSAIFHKDGRFIQHVQD